MLKRGRKPFLTPGLATLFGTNIVVFASMTFVAVTKHHTGWFLFGTGGLIYFLGLLFAGLIQRSWLAKGTPTWVPRWIREDLK